MRGPMQGTKLKNGTYRVVVSITKPDGTPGRKYFERKTLREAQLAAQEFISKNGRNPKPIRCGTLAEALDAVSAHLWKELQSDETRASYKSYAGRIKEAMGSRTISEITSPEITAFLGQFADKSPRTINEYVKVLNSAFKYAISDLGWIQQNPVPGARKPKGKKPPERNRITREVFDKVLAHVPEDQKLYFIALAEIGCRPSELWTFTPDRVESYRDIWWYVIEKGKTAAASRTVPISDELAHALLDLGAPPFPWIANKKQPRSAVQHVWQKAMKDAGIPYTNPYQIRSMRLNEWRRAGVGDDPLTKMAGHTDIRTTDEHYRNITRDEVLEALGLTKKKVGKSET